MSDENKTATMPAETAAVAAPASASAPATVDPVADDKPAATEAQNDTKSKTDGDADKAAPMLKTTAQIDRTDHKKNVKSDPTTLPVTDDADAIRGQVEYYFGDANLPRDKFLWEQTGGEENKAVPLKTLCSFQRMRRFQPYSAVVAALRESRMLVIAGDENAETVARKHPYRPSSERKRKAEAATVYVKGFGDEVATTQFDIEAFFAQHGPINYIKLRRTNEKLFKGSVFVEFQDEETAKKFIDAAPKWKGHELKIMTKRAYCDEKSQLIREGKIQPSSSGKNFFEGRDGGSRGRGRGNRNRDGYGGGARDGADADDWKKRREDDRKNGFRGGRSGRGGRGRGRGGRGRGRGGRDRNDRDRENKGEQENKETTDFNSNGVKPRINVGEPPKDVSDSANGNGAKRAREDDGGAERPTKKVDVKTDAAAAAAS